MTLLICVRACACVCVRACVCVCVCVRASGPNSRFLTKRSVTVTLTDAAPCI